MDSPKQHILSVLSRGYGTWDGIAKTEPVDTENDIFSLEDLRLPPISNAYQTIEHPKINYKKTFDTKPFQLPNVKKEEAGLQSMPKTYTTRKGALLLYAEDYFLPGSPKPKKRRRKIKRQTSFKLRTLTDLRDYILNYKRNGGDPLFLALLQKRINSSYDNHVRPGFSPKRYIATLGRSLQEESWNKLVSSGSFKDPALQSYNPYLPSIHRDGSVCGLFSSKPQPYSTMSLPPISPSSSMLGSTFNFYNNGMSTGAASMISMNSEEYAPSSRAMSPVESLNERLSEVAPIKPKQDYKYALLDSRQKEELLSQMLVKRTLETMDSDLQNWPSSFSKEGMYATENEAGGSAVNTGKRKSSKGSLKSSSLTSISRLPPIQSAGARPTTPEDLFTTQEPDGNDVASDASGLKSQSETKIQRESEAGSEARVSDRYSVVSDKEQSRDVADPSNVEVNLSDESSQWGDALAQVIDMNIDSDESHDEQEKTVLELVKSLHGSIDEDYDESDTKPLEDVEKKSEDSVDLNDVRVISELEEKLQPENQEQGGEEEDVQNDQQTEVDEDGHVTKELSQLPDGELSVPQPAEETRQENDKPAENDDKEEEKEKEEEVEIGAGKVEGGSFHSRSTSSLSIIEDHGPSPEPPPPITFEQLHDEARAVASRILSRPQSGAVFMDDARAALAMWADRLSTLLDPPRKDVRTSSAAYNRKSNSNEPTNAAGLQGETGRKRKMSYSAGPSPAALRQALMISGGELPGIEALKNLPPIRMPHSKPTSKHSSGISVGRESYQESLKDGETRSLRGGESSAHARSVLTERISNSDLQMEMLNLVSNEELDYAMDRAQTAQGEESDDEQFRAALEAVVTDLKDNVRSASDKKIMKVKASTPPKDGKKKTTSPPFQVKRPDVEKAPSGLQTKQVVEPKGKGKVARKVAAKKDTKKTPKKGTKAVKTGKKGEEGKEQISKDEEKTEETLQAEKSPDLKSVANEVTEGAEVVVDASPETSVRAASESSKRLEDFNAVSPTSDYESRAASSKRSDSSATKESKSPSIQSVSVASVLEQPRLVPRPPEPEPVPSDLDVEKERKEQEKREAELSRKKEKEARAAKRAEERAAAAERRRQEVERKRREKEEAKRKQLEEEARLEKLKEEAEEEMRKRELDMKLKRETKEAERKRKEEEELRKEREERARIEREKRMREEFERKKQEIIAQRKLEEEIRKEQEKMEAELAEASRRAEEERLLAMEESERIALQEKMRKEEEELRRRLEAEERIKEEQRRIQEEQKRMREEAIALLRQKKLQRQLFISGVVREGLYLSLSQRLSRAFTFSYFENLPWSFLNNLRSVSPLKDVIAELKKSMPPTIYELDEEEEEEK